VLLGNMLTKTLSYTYGAITLYGAAFQQTSTSTAFSYFAPPRQ
jgi:hypothetical protein